MVRRLHQRQLLIETEPAHAELEEGAGGDVVAVEDRDVFTAGLLQCRIDVAGLGVLIVGTSDVAGAALLGKFSELGTTAIVQDVDFLAILRPINLKCRENGRSDDVKRFVVGRDEDIDGRPGVHIGIHWDGFAAERRGTLEIAEQKNDDRVAFGAEQQQSEDQPEEVYAPAGMIEISDGAGPAPNDITQAAEDRHYGQHACDVARCAEAADNDRHRGDESAEQRLILPGQRHADEEGKGDRNGDENCRPLQTLSGTRFGIGKS